MEGTQGESRLSQDSRDVPHIHIIKYTLQPHASRVPTRQPCPRRPCRPMSPPHPCLHTAALVPKTRWRRSGTQPWCCKGFPPERPLTFQRRSAVQPCVVVPEHRRANEKLLGDESDPRAPTHCSPHPRCAFYEPSPPLASDAMMRAKAHTQPRSRITLPGRRRLARRVQHTAAPAVARRRPWLLPSCLACDRGPAALRSSEADARSVFAPRAAQLPQRPRRSTDLQLFHKMKTIAFARLINTPTFALDVRACDRTKKTRRRAGVWGRRTIFLAMTAMRLATKSQSLHYHLFRWCFGGWW